MMIKSAGGLFINPKSGYGHCKNRLLHLNSVYLIIKDSKQNSQQQTMLHKSFRVERVCITWVCVNEDSKNKTART